MAWAVHAAFRRWTFYLLVVMLRCAVEVVRCRMYVEFGGGSVNVFIRGKRS